MNDKKTEHLIRMASQMLAWGSSLVEIAEFHMEETNSAENSWLIYCAAKVITQNNDYKEI